MLCLKAAGTDEPKPKGPVFSATPNKNERGTREDGEGKQVLHVECFAEFSMGCQQLFEHIRAVRKKKKRKGKTRKRRKPKTTGQAEGRAVRVEHDSLQRAPLSSCISHKKVCQELRLAFAESSGWGHKGARGGREAEPRLRANPDNQGDWRKETTKLCSKHRD